MKETIALFCIIAVIVLLFVTNIYTANVNREYVFFAHENYILLKNKGLTVTMDSNGDLWLWNEQMQCSFKLKDCHKAYK